MEVPSRLDQKTRILMDFIDKSTYKKKNDPIQPTKEHSVAYQSCYYYACTQ